MRQTRQSGSMRGVWKQGSRLSRSGTARRKGRKTDTPSLTFTAPHSYSTVKTIAWGMPDVSGASAVNTRVHTKLPSAHEAAGALGTRHSPRPLFFEGRTIYSQTSGATCRENANACLDVMSLRGARAPKQYSFPSRRAMDCVACARNDAGRMVSGSLTIVSEMNRKPASTARAGRTGMVPWPALKAQLILLPRRRGTRKSCYGQSSWASFSSMA